MTHPNLPKTPGNREVFGYAASLVERELSRQRDEATRADNVSSEYTRDRNEPGVNPQTRERVFLETLRLAHIHARLLAEARREDP